MATSFFKEIVMTKPYYDLSDANLLLFAENFSQRLTATPAAFQITPQQATALAALVGSFDTTLSAWHDPITRTPIASRNKEAARLNLINELRSLVPFINNNPATTDVQRDELRIKARKRPVPIPTPGQSPLIDIESVSGRTVKIRLHGDGSRKGKPKGVQGASVFTFVGAAAPTEIEQWKFEGLTTKTSFDLNFAESASAGTVWVTANWYNERGETGIASAPKSVNLPASPVVPMGEKMKIAA